MTETELRQALTTAFHRAEDNQTFLDRMKFFGVEPGEMVRHAASYYDRASTKREKKRLRAAVLGLGRDPRSSQEKEGLDALTAAMLTSTGPLCGVSELTSNLLKGINNTLLYGTESDVVRRDGSLSDRPSLLLPLAVTAMGLTNRLIGSEAVVTYFDAEMIEAKGGPKTEQYRRHSPEQIAEVDAKFRENAEALCRANRFPAKLVSMTAVYGDYRDVLDPMLGHMVARELDSRKFWEEVPGPLRSQAQVELNKRFRCPAIYAMHDGEPAYLHLAANAREMHEELGTSLLGRDLTEVREVSLRDAFSANLLGYTGPEQMVDTVAPLAFKAALVQIAPRVGEECRSRARRKPFNRELRRRGMQEPLAYWDDKPGPGSYTWFDWQHQNESVDVRVGDSRDVIAQQFARLTPEAQRDYSTYFMVPFWTAEGQIEDRLGVTNYLQARKLAARLPLDQLTEFAVDTLAEVSAFYEVLMR